jgi:uncharacterized protein (DUF58 family)
MSDGHRCEVRVSDLQICFRARRPDAEHGVVMFGCNLAVVRERLFRVIDRLEKRHALAFVSWLDGLSADCATALYRKLAAQSSAAVATCRRVRVSGLEANTNLH